MILTPTLIAQIVVPIILFIIGILIKKFPREKVVMKLMPICINIGKVISKFLILRLGKFGADNVVEGVIVSTLDILSNCLGFIRDGLLCHNEQIIAKKQEEIKIKEEVKDAK